MAITLLVAIDRSPAARQAARLLAGYRGEPEALSLVLLNVQPAPFDEALAREGQAVLGEAAALLADAGFAVASSVRPGVPSALILEEAARRQAAAIVIGTRGEGVLRGFALGSVALRVAHAARLPVLLVQPETQLPASLGRRLRVLVALDGSAAALRALAQLLAWEAWLGTLELDLAHVAQAAADELASREAEEATREARALLQVSRRTYRVHEPAGDPAVELPALARALGSELVAMGTRGLGALHHSLIGSVSLTVATVARAPVLVVP